MDPSITIWHAGSKGPSMKDDLTTESGHREGSMKQRPLRIPFKKYDVHSAAKGEGVTKLKTFFGRFWLFLGF